MSIQVKTSTLNLQRLLKAVTALDIATARARHAAWLQAVKPVFLSVDEAAQVHTHDITRIVVFILLAHDELGMRRASLVSTSMYPSWYCSQYVHPGFSHRLCVFMMLQQVTHVHVHMLTLHQQHALLLHKPLLVQVQLVVSASHS